MYNMHNHIVHAYLNIHVKRMNGAASYSLFSFWQRDLNGDVVNLGRGTSEQSRNLINRSTTFVGHGAFSFL